MEDIYEISVEYLKNSKGIKNNNHLSRVKDVSEKDKKFYKKRIMNMTSELLLGKNENTDISVVGSFNYYIRTLVSYFKMIDKNEIIQEEIGGIDFLSLFSSSSSNDNENGGGGGNGDDGNDEEKSKKIIDEELYFLNNKKKIMNNNFQQNLDGFVKIKKNNEQEEEELKNILIIPQKKTYNLKDPKFKNKGVCKKKNSNILYPVKNEEKNDEKSVVLQQDTPISTTTPSPSTPQLKENI